MTNWSMQTNSKPVLYSEFSFGSERSFWIASPTPIAIPAYAGTRLFLYPP